MSGSAFPHVGSFAEIGVAPWGRRSSLGSADDIRLHGMVDNRERGTILRYNQLSLRRA